VGDAVVVVPDSQETELVETFHCPFQSLGR
jgi:hypothetical protein